MSDSDPGTWSTAVFCWDSNRLRPFWESTGGKGQERTTTVRLRPLDPYSGFRGSMAQTPRCLLGGFHINHLTLGVLAVVLSGRGLIGGYSSTCWGHGGGGPGKCWNMFFGGQSKHGKTGLWEQLHGPWFCFHSQSHLTCRGDTRMIKSTIFIPW